MGRGYRMTPNNEETKKKIVDTSKRIEVSSIHVYCAVYCTANMYLMMFNFVFRKFCSCF